MKLNRDFYARDSLEVAQDLLGKYLVHHFDGQEYIGRIVETEAYIGQADKAAHARFGETERNKILFGPPGHAYVYLIYGMYDMLNFITETAGFPAGILIRAVEPVGVDGTLKELRRLGSGPGKLTRWMRITRALNGKDLESPELFVEDRKEKRPVVTAAKRVGVAFAGEYAHKPWRFYIKDNPFVSQE